MNDEDAYTTRPTHVRVWQDWNEWYLDGADDEFRYTVMCWSYDSFEEAVSNIPGFIYMTTNHDGIVWQFRQGRRSTIRPHDTYTQQEATA